MTDWLLDPQECVARLSPWREPCKALTSRNEAVDMKATRVVHTTERKGTKRQLERWAFGHVAATRDSEGIRLEVGVLGSTHTSASPVLLPQHAQYAADCLRAAVANTDGKACAGKSITELLWDALDALMDILMEYDEQEPTEETALTRGKAEGVAYALAVFQNPYLPNLDAVREQAIARWEERGE